MKIISALNFQFGLLIVQVIKDRLHHRNVCASQGVIDQATSMARDGQLAIRRYYSDIMGNLIIFWAESLLRASSPFFGLMSRLHLWLSNEGAREKILHKIRDGSWIEKSHVARFSIHYTSTVNHCFSSSGNFLPIYFVRMFYFLHNVSSRISKLNKPV